MNFLLYLFHCIMEGVLGCIAGEYSTNYTLKDGIIGAVALMIPILFSEIVKTLLIKVKKLDKKRAKIKAAESLLVTILLFCISCIVYELIIKVI